MHKGLCFARREKEDSIKGRSPPQELEQSPHSELYLLALTIKLLTKLLSIGIRNTIKSQVNNPP